MVAVGVLLTSLIGWGSVARIESAVIAQATISVDGDAALVQHPDGGQILEMIVRNGQEVNRDDPLLRLDTSRIEDELEAAQVEADVLRIRIARLSAQIAGATAITTPLDLHHAPDHPLILRTLSTSQSQLNSWHASIGSQVEQVERTPGLSRTYRAAQVETIRAAARLQSENERGAASEQLALVAERVSALEGQISRAVVVAPIAGTVYGEASLHAGRVVLPGETLLYIARDSDDLIVEARIQPSDVDAVAQGDAVRVRLPGLNQRSTPELSGVIDYIAPEPSMDQATATTYFDVTVRFQEGEMDRVPAGSRLMPGMPAEALITLSDRTALEWLLKPVFDQFAHALRED